MEKNTFKYMVFLWAALIMMALTIYMFQQPYYLPAEVVAENETSTYFGCQNGHIYSVSEVGVYPDDVPYLLYMDPHGTKDPTDDEILVIWQTN